MRHAVRLGLLGALLASAAPGEGQEPVHVRILPVDLLAEPAQYLLSLECGDYSLASVSVGLILPPSTIAGQIDFGGCALQFANVPTWNCASATGLGATVQPAASSARMGAGGAMGRTDTLYANLVGAPLCESGEAVDLADIHASNLVGDPAPMLVATSQRVNDALGLAAHAVTESNEAVPIEQIHYDSGPAGDGPELVVEPVPLTDPGSLEHRFVLLLEGPEAFDRITLGLILPQGISAAQVSFGGCSAFKKGGNLAQRDCVPRSPDLGPNVDAALSGTLGPAAGLGLEGARTDTLYLILDGRQPLGGNRTVLNLPGNPSLLGLLEFDEGIAADLEDLLPPITTLGIPGVSLPPWTPRFPTSLKEKVKPARGSDSDGDGSPDTGDKCPHYDETDRFADADSDDRGNECECTDQNGDGRNDVSDLPAINRAIFTPALATPLCDGNNDAECSVSDLIAANIEIFSPTSTSICSRQPVPGPP